MEETNIQEEEVKTPTQTEEVEEVPTQEAPLQDIPLPEIKPEDVVQAKPMRQVSRKSQESNMRELRLAKERAERDRALLQERLEAIEAQTNKKKQPSYGDDDFIEGKHLKSEIDSVKTQLKNYERHNVQLADEARLKSKYNNFDSVVNAENIERLKDEDPEFAEMIALSSGSLYSRGASTYKRIRDLGIHVEDTHAQEKERAQQNASKPKSMNSISPQRGDSPLGMANAFASGLTPDLKKQLWKEMQDASKKH